MVHHNSGKSDAGAFIAASLARFGRHCPRYGMGAPQPFRPTKGWVISATGLASKSIIQPKIFDNGLAAAESHAPFIPTRELLPGSAGFNQNDQILKLRNGSIIEFKTAEAKTISFAGAGLDWIMIDEECPKAIFDELTIRIGAGKTLLLFSACTLLPPEGVAGGVSWMFSEIIKPWQANPSSKPYRLFGWSIYDNPYLLPEEIRRLEAKYPLGSVDRAIRLDGQWLPGMAGARAYTSFEPRLHVRPQPPLNPRRPICWTWDFNVEPMATLIGQRDGDLFRVHRELIIATDASIPEMVQFFHEAVPSHAGEVWVYGDATARKRNDAIPGGRSEYGLILNLMRTYGSPVRLKVRESNPLVPDRINAVNVQLVGVDGVAHVEIDPGCKELIDDFEQVLRDGRGGLKKTHNRHDPYFKRTHPSDAFGYWVEYEEPVRVTSVFEKLKRAIRQPSYRRA